MDWNDCLKEQKAKKTEKDPNLMKASLEMSDRWLKAINELTNNENNAPIIVSNAYEALLSTLNALLSSHGYKSYSHECITHFLKEVLKQENMAINFDRNRKLRNGVNYYGQMISPERANESLIEVKKLIKTIRDEYL